jgi:hypothetical protein
MASTFLKAERVVSAAIGLLLREVTLPGLVWRDAGGDFAGAKGDTISIRLPAYAPARTRALRSGAARTRDDIHERKVDVTLSTDIYKDIRCTDEMLTLDIRDFGTQVLDPVTRGIVLALESQLATLITGATYQNTITHDAPSDDPFATAVKAKQLLDNAFVPAAGRVIVTGSAFEAALLTSDKFVRVDASGSDSALREAQIGRVAGFTVVSSPAIPTDQAYAFHPTAYVLSQRAPMVPAGAPWGASLAVDGFALRAVRVLDSDAIEDILAMDAWVGTNVVKDFGHYDADPAAGGKFVPVVDPANPITGQADPWANDAERLVRAVKITVV